MKEYVVAEGTSTEICLDFEESVQRGFEANVTRQPLVDILSGNQILLSNESASLSLSLPFYLSFFRTLIQNVNSHYVYAYNPSIR